MRKPRRRFQLGAFLRRQKWGVILLFCGVVGSLLYAYHQYFLRHSRLRPVEGGIYMESSVGSLRNLSPFAQAPSIFERDLRRLIYRGLLRYDPVLGEIESGLADHRISDDGKTYFLTLKPTARFQDGALVTTDDVIFTFEKLIQDPNFPNRVLHDAFEYVTIDVVDDRELAFHIPEKNVFFPSLLSVPIVPAMYFQGALIEEVVDPDFPFNKDPIGAGPFRFKQVVPNDDGSFRVFLEPNQFYYAGKPLLEQVVFYVYPTFEHLQLQSNWPTAFSALPFRALEEFESRLFGEFVSREYILPRFVGVFFNLDRPIVEKMPVRQALEKSMNKDQVIEEETGWGRVDSPFFFEGLELWHEYDPKGARALLRDNGFPYNSKEERRTFGRGGDMVDLRMITSTDPPVYSRFAQRIAKRWEQELGIEVEVDILNPQEFIQALEAREYDMVLFGQDFSENSDLLSLWHSSQSGKLNLSNLTRDDIDFLIDDYRFSGAQNELAQLSKKLSELVPAVVFATPKYKFLLSKHLKGFSSTFGNIHAHADRFEGIGKWYFFSDYVWDVSSFPERLFLFLKWVVGIK